MATNEYVLTLGRYKKTKGSLGTEELEARLEKKFRAKNDSRAVRKAFFFLFLHKYVHPRYFIIYVHLCRLYRNGDKCAERLIEINWNTLGGIFSGLDKEYLRS